VTWQTLLKNASLGILTMAAVKLLQRDGDQEHSGIHQVVDFALGGVLAAAYSRLIPWEDWGIESGIAFAQLPMVASLAGLRPMERERAELAGREAQMARQAAELALWGALTGTAMRMLGETPGERRALDS
jgi:hypothetical protein